MSGTTYHRSPYLCLADQEFTNSRGQHLVPVYKTSDATLLMVPTELAGVLAEPVVDTSALPDDQRDALVELGLIGTDPETFRQDYYRRLTDRNDPDEPRAFVLLPTSYCNMGCDYCGQSHSKGVLDRNHRDVVLARVFHGIADPATRAVHVGWFGGEPLMAFAAIRDMAPRMVAEARAHDVGYSSSITTNGSLLDHRKLRTLAGACGVDRIDITIDGPREIHDAHRPLKSGGRSFDRLVGFLADVVTSGEFPGVSFVLRTNVDVGNSGHVSRYLTEMADRGFAGQRNVLFQLSPIHSWGNDIEALRPARDEIARQEIEWFDQMVDLDLTCAPVPSRVVDVTCAAVSTKSEVISANGAVFSCTEHPLVPEHERNSVLIPLADLGPRRPRPTGQFDAWPEQVAAGETHCSTCWMLPVCGGNCPKLWAEGESACPSMKANLPQRLAVAARMKGYQPIGPAAAS